MRKSCLIIVSLIFCSKLATEVKAEENLYYIHSDHLGSTTIVTDESGNVVSQQTYYPYGETRGSQLPITNYPITERQYTGQVSDIDQTGLYYYNARYYNPKIAKFTQADTEQGPNRYLYVGNNPVKHIDPSGHESESTWQNWWVQPQGSGGSESSSSISSGVVIGDTYYPQGFAGCSTGAGWATAGNCGPPQNPEVDMAPTFVLGGFMLGAPAAFGGPATLANPLIQTALKLNIFADVADVSINAAKGNYGDAALALTSPVPGHGLIDDLFDVTRSFFRPKGIANIDNAVDNLVLFHGTDTGNLSSIREHGLIGHGGYETLTDSFSYAGGYATATRLKEPYGQVFELSVPPDRVRLERNIGGQAKTYSISSRNPEIQNRFGYIIGGDGAYYSIPPEYIKGVYDVRYNSGEDVLIIDRYTPF